METPLRRKKGPLVKVKGAFIPIKTGSSYEAVFMRYFEKWDIARPPPGALPLAMHHDK